MTSKIILLALSAGIFSSCSTTYKNGQTPDDVYYSPVKYVDEKQNNDRDEVRKETREDNEISMSIRDRRWRDFNDDYDYRNSPYYYCHCNCANYGYYYNPSYHVWPVYISKITPVNTTPRMVNLNAYRGYNSASVLPKSGNGINWVNPSATYNNSNEKISRKTITPDYNSSSNNTRSYSPSTNNSNTNSSSGTNSSGTIARPKRGG